MSVEPAPPEKSFLSRSLESQQTTGTEPLAVESGTRTLPEVWICFSFLIATVPTAPSLWIVESLSR